MEAAILKLITEIGSLGLAAWMVWFTFARAMPRLQSHLEKELDAARRERTEFRQALEAISEDHRAAEAQFSASLDRITSVLDDIRRRSSNEHPRPLPN